LLWGGGKEKEGKAMGLGSKKVRGLSLSSLLDRFKSWLGTGFNLGGGGDREKNGKGNQRGIMGAKGIF